MADEVKNDGNIINKRTKFLHDLEQFRLINVGRVPKNVHLEEKETGRLVLVSTLVLVEMKLVLMLLWKV